MGSVFLSFRACECGNNHGYISVHPPGIEIICSTSPRIQPDIYIPLSMVTKALTRYRLDTANLDVSPANRQSIHDQIADTVTERILGVAPAAAEPASV